MVDENGTILYHENIGPGLGGYWVEAGDLRLGDVFLGANGELSTLTGTSRIEYSDGITVYNITVEGNHDYFVVAQGEYDRTCILVHNAACPNPYGKKGGIEHQNKIKPIEKNLKARGFDVQTEVRIATPNGSKPYRVVDIAAYKNGRLVEIHQVGRALKNGLTPVARERIALRDLRHVLKPDGVKRIFHAYN